MSKLVVVPTPIGNLEDITLRAIRALKESDFILAEDTRKTLFLLKHLGIEKKLFSYHAFNEHKLLNGIIDQIKEAEKVCLVSDAGTPGISDPGFLLVRELIAAGIEVECLPGPTAFVPALVASGLPCDTFVFEGFLPHKKGRETAIKNLLQEERTMVFYESPFRLLKTLEQFIVFFGENRKVAVCRELTKIHEEITRGSLKEVLAFYKERPIKGEIVIVLEGCTMQGPKKKSLENENAPNI